MCRKLTQEEFEEKANKIHNNKYDYSKTKYMGSQAYIQIICPIHGEFSQTPTNHLRGSGCSKCGIKKRDTIRYNNSLNHKYKTKKGYILVIVDNPSQYSIKYNRHYVFEHHYVYVNAHPEHGPIDSKIEEIHHRNRDKSDNRIENLEIRKKGHGAGGTHEEETISNFYKILDENPNAIPEYTRLKLLSNTLYEV